MSDCYEECPLCNGTTFDCPIAETPCVWCDGEGVVPHDCPQFSGSLRRQAKLAAEDFATWPEWMHRAVKA